MPENVKYSLTAISIIAIKSRRTNQVQFLHLKCGVHSYGRRESLTGAYNTILAEL